MKPLKRTIHVLLIFSLVLGGPVLALAKSEAKSKKTEDRTAVDSAEDLGFSQDEIRSDPQFQKTLEARTDMLKIHQTLGLITAVPMTTEFILGIVTANNVENGSTDTGLHATLGIATAGLYITTAMFAILAPKPKGMKASGNTELHQILSWIHGPLMILTPLVGAMVNDRVAHHQALGDLGTLHGLMGGALVTSYLASLAVITF